MQYSSYTNKINVSKTIFNHNEEEEEEEAVYL